MLSPQSLTTENCCMPERASTLENIRTEVDHISEEGRHTLAAIFAEPLREDISFEKVADFLKEIEAHIEADEDQGCWLIAITIGEGDSRILVAPRHRGHASRELVEKLRDTLRDTPRFES